MSASAGRGAIAMMLVLLGTSCDGKKGPPPSPQSAQMGGGLVARAGQVEVSAASVARIASAQRIDAAAARELAIKDALFTAEARARGLDAEPPVSFSIQTVLARRLLHTLIAEAENAGPVTDEELRETTARHWLELDRPEAFRTVHAVIMAKSQPADRRVTELAEAIAKELGPAKRLAAETAPPQAPEPGRQPSEDPVVPRFRELATAAFDREKAKLGVTDLELRVEGLPPVAADGRIVAPEPGRLDVAFASAAARLGARGDLGPPVASPFGVHVIMLLERTPAKVIGADERRKLLRDEIIAERARAAQRRLLEQARREVEIDRSVDSLLALVSVEP